MGRCCVPLACIDVAQTSKAGCQLASEALTLIIISTSRQTLQSRLAQTLVIILSHLDPVPESPQSPLHRTISEDESVRQRYLGGFAAISVLFAAEEPHFSLRLDCYGRCSPFSCSNKHLGADILDFRAQTRRYTSFVRRFQNPHSPCGKNEEHGSQKGY